MTRRLGRITVAAIRLRRPASHTSPGRFTTAHGSTWYAEGRAPVRMSG